MDAIKVQMINDYIDMVAKSCCNLNAFKKMKTTDNKSVVEEIREILRNIGDPEELSVAFFTFRCNNRYAQWASNLSDDSSAFFAFYNFLFWESLRLRIIPAEMNYGRMTVVTEDSLSRMLLLAEEYYKIKQNKDGDANPSDKVQLFYDRVGSISRSEGDIHSYEIMDPELKPESVNLVTDTHL